MILKKLHISYLILSLILVGCGKNEWPSSETTTFIQSCVANGGNIKACQCTLEKLQKKYTFAEFDKTPLDQSYPVILKFAQECQK